MDTPRTPVDLPLAGDDLPPPEWQPIGDFRPPTWDPPARASRSMAPMIGIAVVALGAAGALGLYMRHEKPPEVAVAAATKAGEHVTLPLPTAPATPPVTELPATPQTTETAPAPAKAEAKPEPKPRAERHADAAAPKPSRVAQAALKPLALPTAPEPVESSNPTPTPPAAPPAETPQPAPPAPSTQQ